MDGLKNMWKLRSALRQTQGTQRPQRGMQSVGCPVVRQRNNRLASLHLPPRSSRLWDLVLSSPSPPPHPHWPLLFLPWSSLSPPPSSWKQLGPWWLRTGSVEGREARAVYRNWSSSIHQLCLELETKHNKYLGSSPAVLSLNLAI